MTKFNTDIPKESGSNNDAISYFKALASSTEFHELRLIMDGGRGVKQLRNFKVTEQSIKELMAYNRAGYGVFATVNQTDGRGVANSNITRVKALFVDFDDTDRDNLAVINSMKLVPNMVIESSPNKYHTYWHINDCPLEDFKRVQLALIQKFNSDPSINDLARIMRVPGFYHQKDEPFLSRIVSTCDKPYYYEDVVDLLQLDVDAIDERYATNDKGACPSAYDDGNRFEVLVELNSVKGSQILDELYAPKGPMPFLLRQGYGSEHSEFIRLSANHQPLLGTIHAERTQELLDGYLQEVGGNYNAQENEARLKSFNQGHPATIFTIAQELGWLNPNKTYSTGYSIKDDGVYKQGRPNGDGEPSDFRICSWLIVVARTRGVGGYNHGYLLKWRDKDNHVKEQAIQAAALHDSASLIKFLTNAGLSIVPSRVKEVLSYIEGFNAQLVVDCATRTGWYYDNSFVLPSVSFRESGNRTRLMYQGSQAVKDIVQVKGTLADWQTNISLLCAGNSRLVLSISSACAAPMLNLLNIEGGGFHLVGDSSLGKSTALKVASSFYGSPDYMKSWKSTAVALEYTAELYNDLLLPLDELKQASTDTLSDAIYMLANGRGKERGKADGGVRDVTEWRTQVLSSGERTPAELLNEAGGIHAGQEVRLINVPADTGEHGLFEDLHGTGNGEIFSNTLTTNATGFYGSAGAAWIEYLVNNRKTVIQQANMLMASFTQSINTEAFDGQLKRVLNKFSLLAAAGELATSARITGWHKNEATAAMTTAFKDYLNARGGTGKNEDQDIIDKVRASLMSHGASRFENVSDFSTSRYKTHHRLGYKVRADGARDYLEIASDIAHFDDVENIDGSEPEENDDLAPVEYYYLLAKQGIEQLAKGYSAKKIVAVLDQRGYLATTAVRKQKKWNPSKKRLPMEGSWFYTIKPEIFNDKGD